MIESTAYSAWRRSWNVSFKCQDFLLIHDERIAFYDTDFTKYVRTLLAEYTSKTFGQREYLYAFRMISPLRDAIQEEKVCKFYTNENTINFVPISIETSPIHNHNFIIGIDINNKPHAIRLSTLQKLSISDNKVKITEEMCELINGHLEKLYEEELKKCS